MNQLIKPAKDALVKEFGYKNVSVKNGTGTAWGWVHINIIASPRNNYDLIRNRVNQVIADAWSKAGLKPYTFSSDDGYNDRLDCVLIQVRPQF